MTPQALPDSKIVDPMTQAAVSDLVSLLAASFVCFFVDMAAGIVLGVALTKLLPRGATSLQEDQTV